MPDAPDTEAASTRGRRPAHGDPVIDRALRLLSAFSDEHRSLGLTDLARRAGLPTSTALRLAQRLVEWGALERREDGTFVIGLRLWEVASLAPRGMGLRQVALPFMTDLAEITHENIMLGVLDGTRALLIERISGHQAIPVLFSATDALPLHSTSLGNLLLAYSDAEFQEQILTKPMLLGPEKVEVTAKEMRGRLAQIRRDGFCMIKRLPGSTLTSVAAPILDARERVVAGLSVVSRSEHTDSRALIPAVRSAAKAISRGVAAEGARAKR